jgi:hypothetical protein
MSLPLAALSAVLTAAFAAVVTAAALLIGSVESDTSARAQCAQGEAARNPRQDGLVMPTNQNFRTIAEAERFACFTVPYPRDLGVWRFQGAIAHRSHDIDMILESGRGYRAVNLWYGDDRDGTMLRIDVFPGFLPQSSGPDRWERSIIQDVEARIGLGGPAPNFFTVEWLKDDTGFMAHGFFAGDFTRDDLMRILESIE